MNTAVVTTQVAEHGSGLFGADIWGVLAIALAAAACIVLGFGLRVLMNSRQHEVHRTPGMPGCGPRYGSRGQ